MGAGFEYKDAGVTAEDTLDGVLTDKVTQDCDHPELTNAFYSRRSCAEIGANMPTHIPKQSGFYVVTVYGEDNTGLKEMQRRKVYCFFDGNNLGVTLFMNGYN